MGCPWVGWGRAESIGETLGGETALTRVVPSSSWGFNEQGSGDVFLRDGELHGGGSRGEHRRRYALEGRKAWRSRGAADRRIPGAVRIAADDRRFALA